MDDFFPLCHNGKISTSYISKNFYCILEGGCGYRKQCRAPCGVTGLDWELVLIVPTRAGQLSQVHWQWLRCVILFHSGSLYNQIFPWLLLFDWHQSIILFLEYDLKDIIPLESFIQIDEVIWEIISSSKKSNKVGPFCVLLFKILEIINDHVGSINKARLITIRIVLLR